jgi:hypothetical protein
LAALRGGERVMMLNTGAFELVQIEIENSDLHHVGVVVEAGEGVLLQESPLRLFKKLTIYDTTREVSGFGVLA